MSKGDLFIVGRFIDLTGEKIGRWVILQRGPNRVCHGGKRTTIHIQWFCRCECGRELLVNGSSLRNKQSRGCLECSHIEKRGHPMVHTHLLSKIKRSATLRGIPFSLTREYVYKLLIEQDFKCALTGEAIHLPKSNLGYHHKGYCTASLDRIDSSKGYEPGNVQWVHNDINRMKFDFNQKRFITLCKKVAEKYRTTNDNAITAISSIGKDTG